MTKFKDLPSVKLHNKVSNLRIYFNSKYDCKNNQIERQHYNYILSKAINMIAELKYDDSNKVMKQLAKLQLQNVVVKAEYATKINNPKYLDQYPTLREHLGGYKHVKLIGVDNEKREVVVEKHKVESGYLYTIKVASPMLKNHLVYRTYDISEFMKIFEETCHDTRFEMYDYINNITI